MGGYLRALHGSSVTRSVISVAALVMLIGLLFAVDVYTTYTVFTSSYPGANDFYSRWKGAQVYWAQGVDPYSEEATLAIQQGIYGRPAQPGEDPGPFAYPLYTIFLLIPIVWLPYAWAEAVWLVILQFALICSVLLYMSLLDWRLPGWLLALTGLWTIIFYHGARTIALGQFAALVLLWTVGTLWALRRGHEILAGALLALTTIKPQMSVLLIPILLFWGLGRRRWRFLAAFGAATLILLGASFVLMPGWLLEFVRQVMRYPSYTAIGSPVWVLTHYFLAQLAPELSQASLTWAEVTLSGLLIAYLLWTARHISRVEVASGSFQWLVGLTLIVTNLVALRTATTNFVALYIPLFFGLSVAATHYIFSRHWPLLLSLFYLLSVVGLWALFAVTVEGKFEHPIMYLPLPVGLLIAFVGSRRVMQKVMIPIQSMPDL